MDETNEQYIDLRFTSEDGQDFDSTAAPFRIQDEALGTQRSNQGRDRSSPEIYSRPIKVETDCHPKYTIHNSPTVQRVFLAT